MILYQERMTKCDESRRQDVSLEKARARIGGNVFHKASRLPNSGKRIIKAAKRYDDPVFSPVESCPVFQLATTSPFVPHIQFLSSQTPSLTLCRLKSANGVPKRGLSLALCKLTMLVFVGPST